ncbi:MAG: GtrA family protein [Actinomycetota bacterium]|nr:GtrA family protein [Actinomycetota bacterium]
MTCPLALRRNSFLLGEAPDPARAVLRTARALNRWLSSQGTVAQLTRFGGVGLVSSALYAGTFVMLGSLGSLAANLIGMVTSTLLANELHRRLTFHASAAVGWLRAQLQGGGLAIVGLIATSSALVGLQAAAPSAGWTVQVLTIGAITGSIGLVRFAALRAWVFTAARRARDTIGALTPQH